VTDLDVVEASARRLLGAGPLCYVDTSRWHPWAAYEADSGSCYNIMHALIATELMAILGGTRVGAPYRPDVALITQFRAQRELINGLLQDRELLPLASTIHSFQGTEKGTVVLELTQSRGLGRLWGWVTASSRDEEGARLLNVALSRAKQNLVLVADFKHLFGKLPRTAIARRVLEHFVALGTELPHETFQALCPADAAPRLRLPPHLGFDLSDTEATVVDDRAFYPAFAEDVRRARHSIVLFSPFATEERTADWADLLRAKVSEGLAVRVVTEVRGDLWAQGVRLLIDELRGLGVVVDTRRPMHEKIAIIDGKVLWHGSLNILSHSGRTSESMLRIPGEAACRAVATSVSTPAVRAQLRKGDWSGFTHTENPPCPECGSTTTLVRGRKGLFFSCDNCRETVDVRRAGRLLRQHGDDGIRA